MLRTEFLKLLIGKHWTLLRPLLNNSPKEYAIKTKPDKQCYIQLNPLHSKDNNQQSKRGRSAL